MCGITGIFADVLLPDDRKIAEKMCQTIVHRGPDDEGYFQNGNCILGMRRLSIIDLVTGHQPIHNEDKTIWTVLNGEIYNYKSLRSDLENCGHHFYTQSDTEVIVHAYEQYGDRFVEKVNGMFGIAIYDLNKKRLLLIRDRMGIKQLYYAYRNDKLYFGSEIKTILAVTDQFKQINSKALDIYFTLHYVPAPMTIYKDLYALKPGHSLIVNYKEVSKQIPYWQLSPSPNENMDEVEAVRGFRSLFEKAVERRMIADVPLGAFLSGGIDSSAIVAIMSKLSDRPVKTFSIGYGKGSEYYDERSYARIISKMYKTEHQEFIVSPDAIKIIPEIIRGFDQPFADSSAIPNYYVNQMTSKHVTVALSGLGGDELAGGYERYLSLKLAGYYQKIPGFLRKNIIEKLVQRLPDSKKGRRFNDQIKRFVKSGALPLGLRYFDIISCFNERQRQMLYREELKSILDCSFAWEYLSSYYDQTTELDDLTRILSLDINTYMVDDLLTLTDRMSMLHSLEVRVPFLDHELVEFTSSIPSKFKIKGLCKKYLLKKAFKDLLPGEILHRQKKGFSVPLVLWFRTSLRGYLEKVLSPKVNERIGLFNQDFIDRILKEHIEGKNNHHARLWALLIFNEWYDKNISPVLLEG